MRKACALLLLLVAAASCRPAPAPSPPSPLQQQATPEQARVELLWDSWGVPHIYARDLTAVAYAAGWAQARAHGELLLRLFGQARGRAAEYWGESFIDSDVWVRTNGIPARAQQWLAQQYAEERALLDGFTSGINAYAAAHPDSIPAPLRQVLPVEPADVLAHLQRVLHFSFLVNQREVQALQRRLTQPATPPGGEPPSDARGSDARGTLAAPGSNAWAIAPARSASDAALLLANPHLPWGDIYTWYELHLNAPGLHAYGAALLGSPLPGIAFNDSLGWSFTVNTIDAADLYRLELRDDGYLIDSIYRPFQRERQLLRVHAADGSVHERALDIRHSMHGPVVAGDSVNAFALRVAGLDAPHVLAQLLDMNRAQNLAQFEAVLGRLQLPLFNVMYADARGHILSVFNGRVPVRAVGDFSFWRGVVPGNTATTLWTRTHEYWQLPRVFDPATGWLQHANEPPWTPTLPSPLDPDRFPPALAPPPAMSFRAQRSARMLAEDERVSFTELVAYKHSTRMELADHLLEDLIHAANRFGGPLAREAAAVLARWDRTADADSRGGLLFQAFVAAMRTERWERGSPWDVDWTWQAPLSTPDGLSDPRAAAALLERVAQQVAARYGSLDAAWGDVHRLRRDTLDLPASGGPGELGIFRVLDFRPGEDGRPVAYSGDSWVAAIEFSRPVRARALLSYGNASRGPWATAQLPLLARNELRDVLFMRADVERGAVAREAF